MKPNMINNKERQSPANSQQNIPTTADHEPSSRAAPNESVCVPVAEVKEQQCQAQPMPTSKPKGKEKMPSLARAN